MLVALDRSWPALLLAAVLMVPGSPSYATEEVEPSTSPRLDSFNQNNMRCNDWLLDHVWEEAARAYNMIMPKWGQRRLSSMIRNLQGPRDVMASLSQGRLSRSAIHLGRFLVDSTLGLAGAFELGGPHLGLRAPPETFNETFGVYGVGTGSFLILPVIGETSPRRLTGAVFDGLFYPLTWIPGTGATTAALSSRLVEGIGQISGRMPEGNASEAEWQRYQQHNPLRSQPSYHERKELFFENEAYDVEE